MHTLSKLKRRYVKRPARIRDSALIKPKLRGYPLRSVK